MSLELHGRSHPGPNLYESDLISGLWPCGCQGRRGARVSVRFIASKVQWIEGLNNFKGLRVPRSKG